MLTPRRTAALLAAVTIVVALAACASPEPEALPTETPTSTPSSSPTPAPATTRPALADLVLSPAGLGPLVVGAPVPDQPADVAVVSYDPAGCLGAGSPLIEGEPGAGRWAPVYPEEMPFDVSTKDGLRDGAIRSILIMQPFVATEDGIRVGSTLEELLAVYPDIFVGPEDLVGIYTLEDASGALAFEVATDSVVADYWTPEQLNTVVLITAYAPGETVRSIYATDGGGSCPV